MEIGIIKTTRKVPIQSETYYKVPKKSVTMNQTKSEPKLEFSCLNGQKILEKSEPKQEFSCLNGQKILDMSNNFGDL